MLWFTQVEFQFMLKGITAKVTKFHHILANLSEEIAIEVRDLLINPPTENPYNILKEPFIRKDNFLRSMAIAAVALH